LVFFLLQHCHMEVVDGSDDLGNVQANYNHVFPCIKRTFTDIGETNKPSF
jgi:hypothetical protein